MPPRAVPDTADGEKLTSAIGKAFSVIRLLRRSPTAMPLTSVAEAVGIAASSAHSILNQLLDQGVVSQDADKRYQLGPAVFYLGSAFARATPLYRSVWMELVTTANEYGITAAIAVPWDGHHLILNAHRAGDSDVAVPFGGRVPLDAASWGKVYYQWSGDPIPETLHSYTPASITDLDAFAVELATTLRAGYAVDRGEFSEGVGGVCAAVTSSSGYEGLASLLAPLTRIEDLTYDALGRRLASITARASRTLGDGNRMRFFGSE